MTEIGDELSISAKLVPELVKEPKGSKCELKISVTKIGVHTHSLGKTEQMVDCRIDNIEYEPEGEDDGKEESDANDNGG